MRFLLSKDSCFYLDLIRILSGDACRNAGGLVLYRFAIVESEILCVGEMSFPNQSGRTFYLEVVAAPEDAFNNELWFLSLYLGLLTMQY
mgnify:CR=1 FL=1